MDTLQVKNFWIKQSDKDWRVTNGLFKLGHYAHALFFCHLSLEKLLKAIVVQKTKQHSPYTHDLLTLTQIAGLNLDEAQEMQFNEITTFNVRARYDDVKHRFYKKATKTYTKEYIKITGKLRIWIKKSYLKK